MHSNVSRDFPVAIHALDASIFTAQSDISRDVLAHHPQSFESLCRALVASDGFHKAWTGRSRFWQNLQVEASSGRAPFVLPRFDFLVRLLTLQDIAAGLASGAGNGEPISAALGLLPRSSENINSELPPITSLSELEEVLNFGTVFINAASKRWPAAAALCRTMGSILGFPANVNIYATSPGRDISTPVHTDHHDVFIVQTQGIKRWKVFRPPQRICGGPHPCHRGKHGDIILSSELEEPLLDVTLRPGEVLFVPMGFAHATSTELSSHSASAMVFSEASVHLTLGISVADCGLTYGTLITQLLSELGASLGDESDLDDKDFWSLYMPIHVGCLARDGSNGKQENTLNTIVEELVRLSQELDNNLLAQSEGMDESKVLAVAGDVVDRWVQISKDLLAIYDQGYAQVIESAGRNAVALSLATTAKPSAFHSRAEHVANIAVDAATLDPAISAAVRSIGDYCAFLRNHIPETELVWKWPNEFEVVD